MEDLKKKKKRGSTFAPSLSPEKKPLLFGGLLYERIKSLGITCTNNATTCYFLLETINERTVTQMFLQERK